MGRLKRWSRTRWRSKIAPPIMPILRAGGPASGQSGKSDRLAQQVLRELIIARRIDVPKAVPWWPKGAADRIHTLVSLVGEGWVRGKSRPPLLASGPL